jgi:hypothetical protein
MLQIQRVTRHIFVQRGGRFFMAVRLCCEIPFSIAMVSPLHDRFATQMAGGH